MTVEGEERRMSVKIFFRGVIRSLLGENGSKVFEFHMSRILKADPYDVLYDDPKAFCDGLRIFLGSGADALLKVLAKNIVKEYSLKGVDPEEFLKLMEDRRKDSRDRFINLLVKAACGSGEVAP